ncbi:MAG: PBP1A family penicillin-binding protein [Pseudomonadales bacterium]|nr:PBP1A family penicillin-binding protein [Pseudomonadales bacterium]
MLRKLTAVKFLLALILMSGSGAILLGSAVYLYLNPKLPSVSVLREANLQIPLRIYSQNGELIGVFGEKFRTPVKMESVPKDFVHAILAAEDDRFLQHRGVDIAGLLRAAAELLRSGKIRTGGSTITMQVARNFFLSSEQTFIRKFNEIFLALKIERLLSKDEILELYVNKIYLGKRAYGVQAAAAIYYGKSIEELSLAQLAMIAGLPKAPSIYNPVNNPARALIRRNWILGRMLKLKSIDEATWLEATQEPVSASYYGPKLELDAGYAAEMARAVTIEKFGLAAYSEGLKIITSIDSAQQRGAEQAVVRGLNEYTHRHGYRGPEKRLGSVPTEQGINELQQLSEIKGTEPVIIQNIGPIVSTPDGDEQALQLLSSNGNVNEMKWRPTTNPIREYVDENRRAAAITDLSQLLKAGDIIRIRTPGSVDFRATNEPADVFITQLPTASASLVALRPYDGAITSIVGGYDFQQSKFNRATQAYRQPGSNFKPFIYAAAFDTGYTAASVINDAPIVFSDDKLETAWRPENASGKFYGPTTLRRALYLSRNLVSVRLLREMGIDRAISYLQRFEFSAGALPRDLSLALGSYSMTPLEVARLYATIANGGYYVEPYIVHEIRNRNDDVLFRANPALACDECLSGLQPADNTQNTLSNTTANKAEEHSSEQIIDEEAESLEQLIGDAATLEKLTTGATPEHAKSSEPQPSDDYPIQTARYANRVMDERVAFILDSILQDVVRRGTGTRAKALKRNDIAGKTGTTNGPTDAWFSGYHPELVATAWLGFDGNQLLGRREFGGSAALPIWMTFMESALEDVPMATRKQPTGLKAIKIDRMTGMAPITTTTQTLFEKFREEYAPEISTSSESLKTTRQIELHEELF